MEGGIENPAGTFRKQMQSASGKENPFPVIAGLVPAIQGGGRMSLRLWIPGTGAGYDG